MNQLKLIKLMMKIDNELLQVDFENVQHNKQDFEDYMLDSLYFLLNHSMIYVIIRRSFLLH